MNKAKCLIVHLVSPFLSKIVSSKAEKVPMGFMRSSLLWFVPRRFVSLDKLPVSFIRVDNFYASCKTWADLRRKIHTCEIEQSVEQSLKRGVDGKLKL